MPLSYKAALQLGLDPASLFNALMGRCRETSDWICSPGSTNTWRTL